ncbi:MAG: L-threonine 3-dehydrogenase [Capsulimonadales bacterium]|nr:L-threonine 3-dehydrogenase [Capsulimonadales bacterium]
MTTMKAIVKTEQGPGAELREVPIPSVPRDGVLVRIKSVSICGTDFHVYSWDAWAAGRVKSPVIMGHEWAGEVVEVGSEVTSLAVGDFVSGESHKICGHCLQCRTGQGHVCRNTRIFGVDTDGCFAEYFAVPEASVLKNDRRVPPEIACLQDPLGNAVHAALVGEIIGKSVAISGCGPIGLFAIAVCKAVGAGPVIASDASEFRLKLACRLGTDTVVHVPGEDMEAVVAERTDGQGVDVVLEMSGAPSAIQQAMRLARPGGRVSLMGIPSRSVSLDVAEDIIFRGLTVHGVVGRRLYDTWYTMKALLASGKLDVSPILTHRFPLERYAEGMELMRSGRCGKVVLHVTDGPDSV